MQRLALMWAQVLLAHGYLFIIITGAASVCQASYFDVTVNQ
jgi:hypothetical protein